MLKNNKRQNLLICVLCLIMLAFAPSADNPPEICKGGENILPNCNFSAGLQGWVPYFEEGGADVTVLQGGGECHAPDCPAAYLVTNDYFVGGIYQQVLVVPGNTYQANVVWLVLDSLSNDSGIQAQVGPIGRKLGIDPTGGTDPRSPNVVWGPENERRDCKICDGQEVTATAQADMITLFVRIDDRWKVRAREKGFDLPPSKDQFWIDDVGMRQVAGDSAPLPQPDTPTPEPPTNTPEPAPTDTPIPEVATNTPEPEPTDTPDMQTQSDEAGENEATDDEAGENETDVTDTDMLSDTEIAELSAVNTTPTPSTDETGSDEATSQADDSTSDSGDTSETGADEATSQADDFASDSGDTSETGADEATNQADDFASDSGDISETDSNEGTGDDSTEAVTELPTIAFTEEMDRLPTLTPSATPSPTHTPDATTAARRVKPVIDAPPESEAKSSDRQTTPIQTEPSWLTSTGSLLCISGFFLMATAMFMMGLAWLYRLSQDGS
ncbi:hypothetical protein QUF58_10315 [Anaerolineales bacterium HSG24]|nr:hypothetical protein [Anaerolineales bacterium HSG24]